MVFDAADFETAAAHRGRQTTDYTAVVYRLRHDHQFRMEMQAAQALGLGHTQFLALEPQDQAKAIGWLIFDGQRCGKCGTHPHDWPLERETDEVFTVEFDRCRACEALENAWADVNAQAGSQAGADRALRGVKPRLVPNDDLARWIGQLDDYTGEAG